MLKDQSIRVKFLIVFTLSSIIPILVLGIFSYRTTARLIEEQIQSSASQSLNKVATQLNIIMLQIKQYSRNIARDKGIIEIIESEIKESKSSTLSKDVVSNELDSLAEYVSIPIKALIIARTGNWYDNYSYFHSEIMRGVSKILDEDWYRENTIYNYSTRYLGIRKRYVSDFETEYQHLFVQNIHNPQGVFLGILLIEINDYVFDRLLASIQNSEYDIIFLVDGDYNILAACFGYDNIPSYYIANLQSMVETNQSVNLSTNHRQNVIVSLSEKIDSDWHIVHITDRRNLLQSTRRILTFTAAIIAFLIVIEFLLYALINKTITRPIIALSETMKKAQKGVFPVEFKEKPGGEIGVLAKGYNKMLLDIMHLVEQIKEEDAQLKQYELTSLQNQIMPHFLSNTLNSIKLMADLAECRNISQAIVSLINMLQYSIGNLENTATLDREISYITSYIKLSNIRYNNKFHFYNKVPKAYGEIEITKFLLQPLVENSIIHGLISKTGIGNIILSVEDKGDVLFLTVSDDGLGMAPKKTRQILNRVDKYTDSESRHIGLFNIARRIKLMYGNQHKIIINSQIGKGTQVTIPICGRCPKI